MRIATWNVNSVLVRTERLVEWLGIAEPDVLCLQELKTTSEQFPHAEVEALGYEVAAFGTGRWNGVAILSRVGLENVTQGLVDQPGFQPEDAMLPATEPRAIGATCAGVRVWSVYVPNGREVGHAHYDYKLAWLDALHATAAAEIPDGPFAVLGDFNIAPTDADVWDVKEFEGLTHVTEPERAKLAALRDLGLVDVIPRGMKYPTNFTYWDYRGGNFHKNLGMRIDLMYATADLADNVTDAYVDRDARKGKSPSDHAPVVVDISR